jgi:hypothetical protein
MKKIILSTAFVLLTGILFGQTLQKGNMVSLHVERVNLDPDITFNQLKKFYLDTYIPAFNNEFQGEVQLYMAEGDRGDDVNCVALLIVFKSMEVRDKYFPEEATPTELWRSKIGNMQAIIDEGSKLGTFSEKHYTDWVIQ